MTDEKEEYLKIGEYIPADEESGTPEVISRDYYRQGWIFKDEEAYLDEEHPDRICYIPELSDSLYSRQDFLNRNRIKSEGSKVCGNLVENVLGRYFKYCDGRCLEESNT